MLVQTKCVTAHHPAGALIYRRDVLSIYEVRGDQSGQFCSNLGLFARLFTTHHESLYAGAVKQFNYYLLCSSNENGFNGRLIGFFTKVCPCSSCLL